MSEYTLISDAYAAVTQAGAYHAATGNSTEAAHQTLTALLRMPQTPLLTPALLQTLCPEQAETDALDLLFRMQEIGWITAKDTSETAPELNMERDIPQLLAKLSGEGRALLAEAQGFYLAGSGFPHEAVEDLSALAAEIAAIHRQRRPLIGNNLRSYATGWSAVDAAGNSQIGFWPLQVEQQTFVLVVAGQPSFHQLAFTELVWWLVRRYSGNS